MNNVGLCSVRISIFQVKGTSRTAVMGLVVTRVTVDYWGDMQDVIPPRAVNISRVTCMHACMLRSNPWLHSVTERKAKT